MQFVDGVGHLDQKGPFSLLQIMNQADKNGEMN